MLLILKLFLISSFAIFLPPKKYFINFNIADECIDAYSKKVELNEKLKLSLLEQLKENKAYEKIHSNNDYNYQVYKEEVIEDLETKYYKSEIETFEKKNGFSNEDDLEKNIYFNIIDH